MCIPILRMSCQTDFEGCIHHADDESLVYKDDFGTSYMWDKVPKE